MQSLQNGRGTIALVQKIARATNRKRKAKDILRQASRDSNSSSNVDSNSKDKAPAPAPTPAPTKNKGKGKAKTKADSTCKNLRKKAQKA
jgi:hypothetical protein